MLAGPGQPLSSKATENFAIGDGAQAQPSSLSTCIPPACLSFPKQADQHPITSTERGLLLDLNQHTKIKCYLAWHVLRPRSLNAPAAIKPRKEPVGQVTLDIFKYSNLQPPRRPSLTFTSLYLFICSHVYRPHHQRIEDHEYLSPVLA